ncbi:MAG TPA: type II toxin-antitoxin system RelE/ParE family toxin [Acetobacteraceae bacterium]|nr:type II toxin-antitoxin system RelE/ParE family toxin [Acetobacteraceae bacterium]
MIVPISAEAEADLESIGDDIARDNPTRAVSFVQELRAKCRDLSDMPDAFPLVPRYEHRGIRRRAHGNYLIFYRSQNDRIVVIHVLHGAMDYAPILFPT